MREREREREYRQQGLMSYLSLHTHTPPPPSPKMYSCKEQPSHPDFLLVKPCSVRPLLVMSPWPGDIMMFTTESLPGGSRGDHYGFYPATFSFKSIHHRSMWWWEDAITKEALSTPRITQWNDSTAPGRGTGWWAWRQAGHHCFKRSTVITRLPTLPGRPVDISMVTIVESS